MAQAVQPDPRSDWLRMLGGVLLVVGATILFIRKTDDWAAFPLLLVVAIPCAVVFGLGALGALATGEVARWHAVLAALAGIATWLFFFDMILDEPSGTAFRWLLLVLCVLYVGVAFALMQREAPQASEFVTAAGIAAVLVGVIGVLIEAGDVIGPLFFGAPTGEGQGQSFVSDVWLLLVSLGLVVYGAVAHVRGPAYVGFIGLTAFAILQGAEVNALLEGDEPDSSFLGWPLILLLLGAAGLAAGVAGRRPPPAGTRVPAGPGPREPETTY